MSRSKRSEPVRGLTTADSEKQWKREANRKLRRSTAQALRLFPDPDSMVLPVLDEVADIWSGPKDGRQRFDPRANPRLMRK